ncbi:hypothetical protein [Shewanella metallivivens]|uniref:Glycosyltransferase family 1 protein n=1 Tax=Shewanella metallivivens TaxID=2872342 RepID=A0ABT5TGQ4_9GAMM|nr:hypothetical protein [Shewanella metallivivens]MDD8057632.1 hypothetical protein [Shewanella metallivivens]
MNILFLQQKSYFSELGIEFEGCESTFGCIFTFKLTAYLKKFDLIVSCLEHDKSAREVINFANAIGIPTVFLMDGIYDDANAKKNPLLKSMNIDFFSPCIYSNVFLLNNSFKNYLENEFDTRCFLYTPKRARLIIDDTTKKNGFLITTAITPYFNNAEFNVLIVWIKRLLVDLQDLDLKFFARIFDEKILKEIPELKGCNNTFESLSTAISRSNGVICTPSTVLHSANLYGFKTMVLNYRGGSTYFDCDYDIKDLIQLKTSLSTMSFSHSKDARYIWSSINLKDYTYHKRNGVETKWKGLYINIGYIQRLIYNSLPKRMRCKIKDTLTKKVI